MDLSGHKDASGHKGTGRHKGAKAWVGASRHEYVRAGMSEYKEI